MSNKRGSVELAALLVAFTFIMMGVAGMYLPSTKFTTQITGLASGGGEESYSTLSESFQKEWEYSSSGTTVRGMVVDADNNTFVVGYTGSPYYIYVEKINSSGAHQWDYTSSFNIQQFDPVYDAVAVDSNGNIYLAGYGTNLIGGDSYQDAIIEKIGPTGGYDWAEAFTSSYGSGEFSNDYAGGVAVDSNDNVIVYATGWNHGSSIYYPIIRQYNSSRSLQWEHAEDNTNTWIGYGAGSVAVDSNDNVIATLVASGWYVVKLNSSGDHLWNTTFSSHNENVPYQIAVDSSNNIIIVGDISSSDWHVKKLNPSGTELCSYNFTTGTTATGVSVDANDNILVAGDNYVLKLDTSCNPVITQNLGFNAVSVDSYNPVVAAGIKSGNWHVQQLNNVTPDTTPPNFLNPVNTSADFRKGSAFTANITMNNSNLSSYIFSTNASGSWQNDSAVNLGGVPQYNASKTKTIQVNKGGAVCWYYWANDTSGNNATSGTYCFAVQNSAPTQGTPILNSTFGTNLTTEDLTVYNQSTSDADGDLVRNKVEWYRNSSLVYNYSKEIVYPGAYSVLYMPFDESAYNNATFARDYSPYSNNGTVTDADWNSTGGPWGNGAYQFDGNDDYITITNGSQFNFTSGFTIAAWINPSATSATNFIIYGGDTPGFSLGQTTTGGGKWQFRVATDSAGAVWSDNTVSPGWHHVVGIRENNDDCKMYVDGVVQTTTFQRTGSVYAGGNLVIGSDSGLNFDFAGALDDLLFINRSLSQKEVLALYNSRPELILSNETSVGDTWKACITPNDGIDDGDTNCSNDLTVLKKPLQCGDSVSSDTVMDVNLTGCTGNGLNITASNVLLDCNGSMISGDNAGTDNGIEIAAGLNNVTVRNCNIYNFSGTFEMGIHALSTATTLEYNTINNCKYGITADDGATHFSGTIRGNTITGSSLAGIWSGAVENTNITNNTVYDNYNGLMVYYLDTKNRVWHNNIYNNTNQNVFVDPSFIPFELSYNNEGNYWGYASCPYFIAGTDSNNAAVTDRHPYASLNGWVTGSPADCVNPNFLNPVNTSADFKKGSVFTANITMNNSNLSSYIFSTNASGSWQNDSAVNLGGVPQYNASKTKTIQVNGGGQVCWYYWANDTSGNNATSGTYCFTAANTPPTVDSVAVQPSSPNATDDLNCTYTASDADNNTLTPAFDWYKNNIAQGINSQVLGSASTSPGEKWNCSVNVTDGTSYGFNVSAAATILDNIPPDVSTASPANGTSTTATNITFTYTPADDTGIESCKLIINDSVNQTETNITNNAENNFSAVLDIGTYSWMINCTDNSTFSNKGSSGEYTLTISSAPSGGGGGPICTDECDSGEVVCRDGSMYVCGDFDSDSCTEWVTENCPKGEECIDGECVPLPCMEDWVCEQWSVCVNGYQTRKCSDWNSCGTVKFMPENRKECGIEKPEEEKPAVVQPGEGAEEPSAPKLPPSREFIIGFLVVVTLAGAIIFYSLAKVFWFKKV